MSPNETNLEMANRHVAEQEARIEKQLGLLTWMEVRDLPRTRPKPSWAKWSHC
jgi:hypothetical protein